MATLQRAVIPVSPVNTPFGPNGAMDDQWQNYFRDQNSFNASMLKQVKTMGSSDGGYVVLDNGTPFTDYPPAGGLVTIDSGGPLG